MFLNAARYFHLSLLFILMTFDGLFCHKVGLKFYSKWYLEALKFFISLVYT